MEFDRLTIFGMVAVTCMLLCDTFERKNHWFTLLFGFSCLLGSTYGFLQGALPFGILEGIWALIKFGQWGNRIRWGKRFTDKYQHAVVRDQ